MNNTYFKKDITYSKWLELSRRSYPFTEYEIYYINQKTGLSLTRYHASWGSNSIGCNSGSAYPKPSAAFSFNICKLEDEWYYLNFDTFLVVYKCDQLDGLVECINMILEKGDDYIFESASIEYYKKINEEEWHKVLDSLGGRIPASPNTLKSLEKLAYVKIVNRNDGVAEIKIQIPDKRWISIVIFECVDEWFLAKEYRYEDSSFYKGVTIYKCDQIDGLIKFINDFNKRG